MRPVAAVPVYQLLREPPSPIVVPRLDDSQRRVVDHETGPLLVLAGPGTGKTTTLVEAIVERVRRGLKPERILTLTFSRRAAMELRQRITARLGATTTSPSAWTFHAFAYALVTAYDEEPEPLRLLSAPEQQVRVRELLDGSADLGTVAWPETLRPAVGTQGLAQEIRQVFARARELGLEPAGLRRVGRAAKRPDWVTVGAFFEEYLDVLDFERAIDYGELVHRAVALLSRPEILADMRQRYPAVFVDEYQDTDPAQEALLRSLAGQGRDLVVVGDADQSIYAFRGADVSGLLGFPDRFRTRDGKPAPIVELGVSYRTGPDLLRLTRRVARRIPAPGLPADVIRAHRDLTAAEPAWPGAAEVRLFRSAADETAAIADALRRAHLLDGLPWQRMAVLVRSGVRSIPALRRALAAAGVPTEVAGDELPLAREPAVRLLLDALRCADDEATLTTETARRLLLSPLGGADPAALRRLARALRQAERDAGAVTPRPSPILLRDAVADPLVLVGIEERMARPARRLGDVLRAARAALHDGTTEDALWALWTGTAWPRELERASYAGGAAGWVADRDLDAVVALFSALERAEQRRGHRGVRNLIAEIEAQEIPGDTLAERGISGDAVRLLTAHRGKGLEWDLVVVAGVQDGLWPDTRRRGSLLEADRITRDGAGERASRAALAAEERRLFYVALTRARERLLVTAVDSPDEDGARPSPFLRELGLVPVETDVRRPLTVPALVADLRAAAIGPDGPVRDAALDRLAALAAARDADGQPLLPAAHPDTWWGLVDATEGVGPLRADDELVALSGSSLARLLDCALRWYLEHEVHAEQATSAAQGFGSIVHTLADEVARSATPADLDVLTARIDEMWPQLEFEAAWYAEQQREAAREAVARYLTWHAADRGREFVASEHRFDIVVGRLRLRGSMDRVERDADGSYVVSDYKTGKNPPPPGEIPEHPQLGVYQYAVERGALDVEDAVSGGAELVQLRRPGEHGALVQTQPRLAADEEGVTWIERALAGAVERILAERFPPSPGEGCLFCAFRRCCPALAEGRQVIE